MQQAMKRMGIQQEEIDASEVIIKCPDHNIVIKNPSVQKVNMMGQKSYQISGEESVESPDASPEISDDDVETVMEQTQSTQEEAMQALKETNGDIAEAILKLNSNQD